MYPNTTLQRMTVSTYIYHFTMNLCIFLENCIPGSWLTEGTKLTYVTSQSHIGDLGDPQIS